MNDLAFKPALRPNADIAAANAANAANAAISASHAGATTGLAEFNTRAGVQPRQHGHHVHHVHVSLRHRRLTAAPSRRNESSKQASRSAESHHDTDHLRAAGLNVVDALQHGDRAALTARLVAEYDVLERHALLRDARSQVDQRDLSESEKDHLKNGLNEMMSDLMDTHGDVIRAGLKNASQFETALGEMDALSSAANENHDPDSLHELRLLYGAKGTGKLDAPLTPLALAKSLQDKFGVDNFCVALGDLRSKMAADLRANPPGSAGPRLWLSLSDAAAFNAVQTGFAIAGDLRRNLSERAGITLALNQAATAMALLGVAELGVARGDAFVAYLVDSKDSPLLRRAQLYMLVRQAVEQLSTTLWRPEMLPQRMKLLDELRTLAFTLPGAAPECDTDGKELEQLLRNQVSRKDKRDRDDGGQDRGQDDTSDGEHEGSRARNTAEK